MKYIKKFEYGNEITTFKYEIGDYVLLDIDKIIDNNLKANQDWIPFKFVQILDIVTDGSIHVFPYQVDFEGNEDGNYCYVKEDEIIRKLAPDEIEEYKMIKNSNKYNI